MWWWVIGAIFAVVFAVWVQRQYFYAPPFRATEIIDGLWLGNFEDARQHEELKKLGITHVVVATTGVDPHFTEDFDYMVLRVLDIPQQDLLTYFPVVHDFMDKALSKEEALISLKERQTEQEEEKNKRAGGKVFIHCMAGASRSATFVISYLMRTQGLSYAEALRLVQEKRSIVNPNPAFHQQLKLFERQLQRQQQREEENEQEGEDNAEPPVWWIPTRVYSWTKEKASYLELHSLERIQDQLWHEALHSSLRLYNYHLRRCHRWLKRLRHNLL
ncbi:Protein-tyrosine phosphatase-like protein [Balamuthia mandrillaris]